MTRTLSPVSVAVLAAALLVSAAPAQDQPVVKTTELARNLFLLSTDQGSYTTNTLAFVGDDGLLLVDTQAEGDAAELKKAVEALGKGSPRYIVNTHRHVEHVGGNAVFGEEPVVIAHDLVPRKLRSKGYIFDEFPDATFPDITFTESLTLYFNDERIEMRALAGSHDDNEIIVHFTGSKVVHLSSLVNGFNFPSVDSDGDILKFAELVATAIEILPDDVTVVSGHNGVGTWQDLHDYRDMLVATTETVRAGLAENKDAETLVEEKALARWERYAGSYVSVDDWTRYLAEGLEAKKDDRETVHVPVYHVWKEQGADAALELYFTLEREHAETYRTDEYTLLVIGDKLRKKGHHEAAVVFLQASLEEYPDADYAYYAAYGLARAYEGLGDREHARRFCERSLELNPDFTAAGAFLAELKRE